MSNFKFAKSTSPTLSAAVMSELAVRMSDFEILPQYQSGQLHRNEHIDPNTEGAISDSDDSSCSTMHDSSSNSINDENSDVTICPPMRNNHQNETQELKDPNQFDQSPSSPKVPTLPNGVPAQLDFTLNWVPARLHPTIAPSQYSDVLDRMKVKQEIPSNRKTKSLDRNITPAQSHLRSPTNPDIVKEIKLKRQLKFGEEETGAKLKRSVRTRTRRKERQEEVRKILLTPTRESSLKSVPIDIVNTLIEYFGVPTNIGIIRETERAKVHVIDSEVTQFLTEPLNPHLKQQKSKILGDIMLWNFIKKLGYKNEIQRNKTSDINLLLQDSTTKRAVFLMSHKKVSVPRPLVQQVLISNLMSKVMANQEITLSDSLRSENKIFDSTDIFKPGQIPVSSSGISKSKLKSNRRNLSKKTSARVLSPGELLQATKDKDFVENWKNADESHEGDTDDYVVVRKNSRRSSIIEDIDDDVPLGVLGRLISA